MDVMEKAENIVCELTFGGTKCDAAILRDVRRWVCLALMNTPAL